MSDPRPTVLVIDDEPLVGRSIRRVLEQTSDVTVVNSGRQALALFAEGRRYEVVLCDLTMPEIDGVTVYEKVRAADPVQAEQFVFISGGVFTLRARSFVQAVEGRCLEKPFDMKRVREVVADMATRARERRSAA